GCTVRPTGRRRVVRRGRRSGLEVPVPGKVLGDQFRADDLLLAVGPLGRDQAAGRVRREQRPADRPQDERVEHAAQDAGEHEQPQVGPNMFGHGSIPRYAIPTRLSPQSISLIPTNGAITPPRPQISRFRRKSASAPTGRYVTPRSAIGMSSGMMSALKITA